MVTAKITASAIRKLVQCAQTSTSAEQLLEAACHILLDQKIPLWRVSLGLEFLHPEVSGAQTVWLEGHITSRMTERAGILQSDEYRNSPIRWVDENLQPFITRLDHPLPDMPLLVGLRERGATGYAMYPLPFLDRSRSAAISFATCAKGGFSRSDLASLHYATDLISPYAERLVLKRIASDLLDTYLGPRIGRRVLSGEIERGHVGTIKAAVWFADLRGFTAISEMRPVSHVLALLDQWFEIMHETVVDHGGDILKFMGDGALAAFSVADHGSEARACRQAFAASQKLAEALGARRMFEDTPWNFGIGMHIGEVAYGNIGASNRLDFTVIGPVVNIAARLEKLTKNFDYHVAVSQDFHTEISETLIDGGKHEIMGIKDKQNVFLAVPKNVQ